MDTNVTENKTLTAQFEKVEYVTIQYIAETGGAVYGELCQTVERGENCTQVYAVAEAGYRFTGWSDGQKSSQRLDIDVTESKMVTACFENINVLFYSNEILVRKYVLNDFANVDTAKIVGYASRKHFEGWRFTGVYEGFNNSNPLILIKSFFVDEKDIPDITLDAVYSESDPETDIPLQSKTIAHALGGINGKNYLNSKEAFETNYQKGFRFFEADVALTTDSVIVLSHDRGQYTYEQFMANKSDDHTPLSLENLFDYMTEFSNIYVDLDTLGFGKDEEVEIFVNALKNLLSNYSAELLNRIIVEITPWNETLIDPLRDEIGITNFLYTEAWYTNDLTEFESICERCSEMGIRYVSLNHNSSCAFTVKKAELLHRYGLYVMLYTFNDPVMLYQLYDIGADCIFTDYVYI